MSIPKKTPRGRRLADCGSYLDILAGWTPGWHPQSRLDSKLARARAQDEPVLCAHLLPGLDVLFCSVRGARAPYPGVAELRQRCLDSILHAVEQPSDRLGEGGYWYEFNGLAILIFASGARSRVLQDFGASQCADNSRMIR